MLNSVLSNIISIVLYSLWQNNISYLINTTMTYIQYKPCVIRGKRRNVNVYFHHNENQGRHTVHTHMLVWVKNLEYVNMNQFKASIPNDHNLLAYLVRIFSYLKL